MNTVTTKQDRLLEALKQGQEFTARQIEHRFKLANPTAAVSNLRTKGYAVYANPRVNGRGEIYTKYRLGTPSRRIVAAGIRALRMGLVD